MTEHDLSTLLRDHLADEPPLSRSGTDAIRTARRQTARRRGLVVGGSALAVATVATLALGIGSSLVDDPAPDVPLAQDPGPALTSQMETAAEEAFTPYVGALGAPDWRIAELLGDQVPDGDPRAQTYQLSFHPQGALQVNLSVGGYAPSDFDTYSFPSSCDQQKAQGVVVSCEMTTLEDGSLLMVTVAPRSRIESNASRMLTLDEAESLPQGQVAWMRAVGLSTRDGMAVDAAEYVRAADAASARWQVPLATLRELVLDPGLREADVAHEPMPEITDE